MYDIDAALDRQIQSAMKNRPTVVLTEPYDPRIIEAACYLTRYARLVFLAPEEHVRAVARAELSHVDPNRLAFTLSEAAFVDIDAQPALLEEFAKACVELAPSLNTPCDLPAARRYVRDPARFGIFAVRQGHADLVVGGMRHEPRDYFRPMLRLLSRQEVKSEAGIFVLPDDHHEEIFPHNIVVFGDVGVNGTMTPEILANVAVGTCAIARDIFPEDVLPTINGAIVSYSNRGSDDGPSPEMVREATRLVPDILAKRIALGERYRSIHIEGEVKVSVALSKRSAAYYSKGRESTFVDGANVIIAPNLELGNFLYHLYATRFPDARKFAVMFGVRFQGVDLAMDSSPRDAILSVKASILRMHRFGHWTRTPHDTFFPRPRILALNPGSTSTKISVYEGDQEVFTRELQHTADELAPFEGQKIVAQYGFRKEAVEKALADHQLTVWDFKAIAGRGGLIHPIPHGTYAVNERMKQDLLSGVSGDHASNLGGLIALELAQQVNIPAFIVDPVVVDEVPDRVKITGVKAIRRKVISHALNQIATARRYAEEHETFYEALNLIVCHMGGGITIGAHKKGHYIDVNDGLDGEGPFTPQRSGTLPTGQLIRLCFSGKYTFDEVKQLNKGKGGMIDLLGTADFREIENKVLAGDPEFCTVFEALVYQISKHITALLPAFDGEKVDQVLLTGGLARAPILIQKVAKYVSALGCGLTAYPGENEMGALAKGALRVISGKESVKTYAP